MGPVLSEDERDADIDTVGGLVFTLAGRVPTKGEIITHPSRHRVPRAGRRPAEDQAGAGASRGGADRGRGGGVAISRALRGCGRRR